MARLLQVLIDRFLIQITFDYVRKESGIGKKQWFVVFFVSFFHMIAFSQRMDVVPFLVELKNYFQVGYAEAGGLLSAFLFGYAVFQIPAGTMADRYSPKVLVLIGLTTMLLASLLFVSTDSLFVALILRFVMGGASAMLFSPGIKLISAFTPKEKRGLSIGILEGAAGIGMLVTLTVFPVVSTNIPYRVLFLILSLLIIPILAVFWKVPNIDEASNSGNSSISRNRNKGSLWKVLRNNRVQRLMAISFFGLFGIYAYLGWLPTYLQTVIGYTKQEAGLIMALVMIAQVIMAPLSGKISDKLGQRKAILIAGSGLAALGAVWLLVFKGWGIYFTAVVIGTSISWSMAPMLTLATEVVGVQMAGSTISVTNTVGQIASAISGFLYGMIYDAMGDFKMIWLACLCAFLIRILFCLGDLEERGVGKIAGSSETVSS